MIAIAILAWGVLELRARGDELTDAVNAVRAQHGLHTLAHSGFLANWAAENNRHGSGHHVLGPALFQNAGWNQKSIPQIIADWMRSPAHRTALLAVHVTHCGGSFDGVNWTLNLGNPAMIQFPVDAIDPAKTIFGPVASLGVAQTKTIESKPAVSPSTSGKGLSPIVCPIGAGCTAGLSQCECTGAQEAQALAKSGGVISACTAVRAPSGPCRPLRADLRRARLVRFFVHTFLRGLFR